MTETREYPKPINGLDDAPPQDESGLKSKKVNNQTSPKPNLYEDSLKNFPNLPLGPDGKLSGGALDSDLDES